MKIIKTNNRIIYKIKRNLLIFLILKFVAHDLVCKDDGPLSER